jgi:hypothetical protein
MATIRADYVWIAAQLNKLRIANPDGTVSFRSPDNVIEYEDLIMLLETYHDFPSGTPDVERRRIVEHAIHSTATAGEITDHLLKANIWKTINLFGSRPHKEYVLVTSLSMVYHRLITDLRFDDADFAFSSSLPPNFARRHPHRFHVIEPLPDLLPDSTAVRVTVSTNSDFGAFQKATDSLDFLRGIWNFRINRGLASRWHSGPVKPVNEIRLVLQRRLF